MKRLAQQIALAALFPAMAAAGQTSDPPAHTGWQFGAFADLAYLFDANHPPNKQIRSRGTAWHVNDLYANMAGVSLVKATADASPWGAEVTVHTGKDDEVFGFSATAPKLAGSDWLRHIGRANLSYRAPTGRGLQLQGGIFASLIGYDSLYAKDNLSYSRPWGADFTPYLMMGVNAAYPITDRLTGTLYVVNGYWHLANANQVPSSGVHLSYAATPRVTIKEAVLWGPHQSNSSLEFWRLLSDTIVERRSENTVVALNAHFSTERVDEPGRPRAWWIAAQVPMRWSFQRFWSLTVRPEIAWDSIGRWTLAEQTVTALTTTVEHRRSFGSATAVIRFEHRLDVSRGPGGGFFDDQGSAGSPHLTPQLQLLVAGLVVTFDKPPRP